MAMAAVVGRKTKHRMDAEAIRRALNLSQDVFAKALGISRRTVIRWKSEHFTPPPQTAEGRLLAVMEEMAALARKTWSEDDLQKWMHSPIPALGGARRRWRIRARRLNRIWPGSWTVPRTGMLRPRRSPRTRR